MPLEPTKHVNGRMWQPGQSGNRYDNKRLIQQSIREILAAIKAAAGETGA
jgi:hypothetical protein